MTLGIVIFGLLTGSLLGVLVGLVGARRRIGFGWTFLISMLLTPLIGLVAALLSDPLPQGERRWGCLGTLLAIVAFAALVVVALLLFAAAV